MVDANFQPTPQACTSLIHGYCSLGKVKEAKDFLDLIERYGLVPDSFMYTPLIDALSRIGDFEEVKKILEESQKKGWKPDEVTYNVYMNGLAKAGMIGEAFGVLDIMRFNGLLPSLETLSVLFDCVCREYTLRESIELLEWSSKLDWSPDVGFYNTLMSRHIENGCYVNVLPLYGGMVKKGIEPDSCTLTLIIRSMYISGKLQFVKCILNADWRFTLDVVLFNTMLHMFYLVGENKKLLTCLHAWFRRMLLPISSHILS
ncbi:hypothetical protein HPP92_003439 [Vanilla planifolia]|uniref:Pentatricopeptide repeat-containing protein n=1 Tax=Vanilla planifolia TaxID=51239 RepID=A0A835SFL5_VANPL|nr:hypothetical protein HPP92_003439 [Vanilla planifolia]